MPNGPTEADRRAGDSSGGFGGFNTGGWFTWGRDILRNVFSPSKGGSAPVVSREELARRAAAAKDKKEKPPQIAPENTYSHFVNKPINEPKRQSGRKAKRRKPGEVETEIANQLARQGIWPYTVIAPASKLTTRQKVFQSIAMAGIDTTMMSGRFTKPIRLPRNRPPRPRAGSKGAQRGFYDPTAVPGLEALEPVNVPKRTRVTPGPRTSPGRTTVLPGGGVQPTPTAPQTLTQEYLTHENTHAGSAGTSAEPVYPGSRPAPAAPSPNRLPGPVGPSTAKPGKTGSRAPVAKPPVGKIVLPLDALIADAIGYVSRRSAGARQAASTLGAITLATGRQAQPSLTDPLTMFAPNYANDPCDCKAQGKKKSERQPRKPRSQCWTGTYTETATGLRKTRRTEVPC